MPKSVDFKNLNEGFSHNEKLSCFTDNRQEGISFATSPEKGDHKSSLEQDRNPTDENQDGLNATDDADQNRVQTNPSTRRQMLKTTTFGVENSNIQTLVNQINKERKKGEDDQ